MANKQRAAIVTGGGGGIGSAIARRLAGDAIAIIVADKNIESAEKVARQLQGDGFEAVAEYCDVCDSKQLATLVSAANERFGGLDIMVNNVGVSAPGYLAEISDDAWQMQLQVNLSAVFYGIREALRVMIPAGSGSIVNISSGAGLSGSPGMGAYGAAKAGVIQITQTAAVENFRKGVRINCVVPRCHCHCTRNQLDETFARWQGTVPEICGTRATGTTRRDRRRGGISGQPGSELCQWCRLAG